MSLPLFPELPKNKRKPREKKPDALPAWFVGRGRELDYSCTGQVLRASMLRRWKDSATVDGKEYVSKFRDVRVTIEITDMHYSMGAMHYYAAVTLPSISWSPVDDPGICTSCRGLYDTLRTVNITAPLPQKEITRDPERYKSWKAGERYPGFLTPQDAYNAAIGWVRKMTVGMDIRLEAQDYEITPAT